MPEKTENYIHIPVKDKELFIDNSFKTIDISDGIKAVIGKLKSDPEGSTHVQKFLFDVDKFSMDEAKKWVSDHKKKAGQEKRCCEEPHLRMTYENGRPILSGYAVTYGVLSDNPLPETPGIKERILPGAFRESVEGTDDVLFLWQHDSKYIFGRKRSGQLVLKDDGKGVWFENSPPDVGWANDLIVSVKRRDIANMSFSFGVPLGGVSIKREGQDIVQSVKEGKLFEISLVTFPVYESTSIVARASNALIVDGIVIEDVKSEEEATKVVKGQSKNFESLNERFEALKKQWL
jgi:HK97 family phage prohead protease